MAKGRGERASGVGKSSSVPTLALRGGLSGLFVDFDLLPDLLADLGQRPGDRGEAISRWSAILQAAGFDARVIDPHGHPVPQPPSVLAAEGAWRFAERLQFTAAGCLTGSGGQIATLANLDRSRRREALAPALAQGVAAVLRGQDGLPIIPLLRQAAQTLAASTNLWVRTCPGLVPVEVGTITYWACVDARKAQRLVRDIEINRDVAMHALGPPDSDAVTVANAERHYDQVLQFYVEQADLGERVPLSFGEEIALARLLRDCGLFAERHLGLGMVCLAGGSRTP